MSLEDGVMTRAGCRQRTLSPKAGKQWPRGREFMGVEGGRRADGGQAGGENVRWSHS